MCVLLSIKEEDVSFDWVIELFANSRSSNLLRLLPPFPIHLLSTRSSNRQGWLLILRSTIQSIRFNRFTFHRCRSSTRSSVSLLLVFHLPLLSSAGQIIPQDIKHTKWLQSLSFFRHFSSFSPSIYPTSWFLRQPVLLQPSSLFHDNPSSLVQALQ